MDDLEGATLEIDTPSKWQVDPNRRFYGSCFEACQLLPTHQVLLLLPREKPDLSMHPLQASSCGECDVTMGLTMGDGEVL